MEVEVFGIDYIGLHNISPGCTMAFRKEIASLFLELYDYKLPHDWFSLGNILMTYVMNSNQLENDTTPFYISILSLMVTSLSYIGGYLFAVNRILYKEKNIRYVLGIHPILKDSFNYKRYF